jgi:YgiT-type zinc finger domain-containing protein
MPSEEQDSVQSARRALAAWHSTHPDATFAEIEQAVEHEVERVRRQLLADQLGPRAGESQPACPHCGSTMRPRSRRRRTVVLRGDQQLQVERAYLVCPSCGEGFFPPG